MKYWILIVASIVLASCAGEEEDTTVPKETPVTKEEQPKYTYKVFEKPDVGWCYQIFRGAKLIIDQQHIPAVPGVRGFDSEEQAELAVQFIMEKVRAGNERPSVSPEELDEIGAINLEDFISPKPVERAIPPPPPPIEHVVVKEDQPEEM